MNDDSEPSANVTLQRRLSLPLLTLYGLGTTIGAGIFVLLGAVVASAGESAPISFILASILAGATALSFAELSARFPLSAGEAVYVKETLGADWAAIAIGLMVISVGTISSAAIASGFIGYLDVLVEVPDALALTLLILVLALVAAWGIGESVAIAALFTLVELGVLIVLIATGAQHLVDGDHLARSFSLSGDPSHWIGILSATVVAFYAFIGFEDMVNVAEEVKDPERAMPRAIVLTLSITLVVYVAVAVVALGALGTEQLGESNAPVADVFRELTGGNSGTVAIIAIISVVNGALIQIIMASRVLYGMSKMQALPSVFATINAYTHTPIVATLFVASCVLILALFLPIDSLARITSFFALIIFATINLGLVRWKLTHTGSEGFQVPLFVPAFGLVGSALLALFQFSTSIGGMSH